MLSKVVEDAIVQHIREMSASSLRSMYEALLVGHFLIPVHSPVSTNADGHTHVPARCLRFGEVGCLLAFTSESRLLEWKAEGSLYAEFIGRKVFEMASGMRNVDAILVNFSENSSTPKGKVTRKEFEMLARKVFPENP
jgi:hypothetical protein